MAVNVLVAAVSFAVLSFVTTELGLLLLFLKKLLLVRLRRHLIGRSWFGAHSDSRSIHRLSVAVVVDIPIFRSDLRISSIARSCC